MSVHATIQVEKPLLAGGRSNELDLALATVDGAGGRRILLASADAAQRLMVARRLIMDGYEVTAHEADRDVVMSLLTTSVDLLLINARPRDRSAVSLVRWTRSRPETAHTTCMAIVAPGDDRLIADLYDAGADFVIMRRTELDLLARKVAAALARRPLALAV